MISIEDWRPSIAEMFLEKQTLAALDHEGVFPFDLPGVAATNEQIAAAEQSLGLMLNSEHRSFLTYADGWSYFYQNVTLLSTAELAESALRTLAVEAFEYTPELLEDLAISVENVLPVAASLEQADVFAMVTNDGVVGSKVLWIAEGELIETFETFGEYFQTMIAYTKRRIAKMQETRV